MAHEIYTTMECKLITTASDPGKAGMLRKSLDKFGWSYSILVSDYYGFGTKMVNAYTYAKTCKETHLFIVDSYDVIVLGTMEEALKKMPYGKQVWNAEKNAWPYEQWSMLYPECATPWRYLNGGCAFVEVESFCKMMEANPIGVVDNDQVILAKNYLTEREKWGMSLDAGCEVFQTLCGIEQSDYRIENGRFVNIVTDTRPVFFHGNGLHPMDEFYKLI